MRRVALIIALCVALAPGFANAADGAAEADVLARRLHLLAEEAIADAHVTGNLDAAAHAKEAAGILIGDAGL